MSQHHAEKAEGGRRQIVTEVFAAWRAVRVSPSTTKDGKITKCVRANGFFSKFLLPPEKAKSPFAIRHTFPYIWGKGKLAPGAGSLASAGSGHAHGSTGFRCRTWHPPGPPGRAGGPGSASGVVSTLP